MAAAVNEDGSGDEVDPGPGIPLSLAAERAGSIENLSYHLSFTMPDHPLKPVLARAVLRYETKNPGKSVVLDFAGGKSSIDSISSGGRRSRCHTVRDHIIIPGEEVRADGNVIEIEFRAGDLALHRNPEFLYTLFVPARAHHVFPCFDQPNLKARFTLELDVPGSWEAVSNSAETFQETKGDRRRIGYAETAPIPPYLFAFAAGRFQVEAADRNGRMLRIFHCETEREKLQRNVDAVFDLHASSLEWLESYTSIPYPFGKFDLVLIPSFQFGGMEHPGAIYYNASSILLDESATESQLLDRASLIAHETSHMWFGDFVTMEWFDDVWMKEVFANFLAAKIVNPAFPNVNHDLRFLLSHYPAAYAVDRTEGAHPIRQELANLNDAGSLYGPIIYQKAPIVMRQLERILGADTLRDGLREFLKAFRFGNAAWPDLVGILDSRTPIDLREWSRVWVDEAGRPSIRTRVDADSVCFIQSDSQNRSLRWAQQMQVHVRLPDRTVSIPLEMQSDSAALLLPPEAGKPEWILPTGGGLAYGGFTLDDDSRTRLLHSLHGVEDPLTRGAAWITLWEEMLDGRVGPTDLLHLALRMLPEEDTEQNVQLLLSSVNNLFWTFLSDRGRRDHAAQLEGVLREGLQRSAPSSMKSTYFSGLRNVITTPEGVSFLERVWNRQEQVPGLVFAESDEATMALELAVRLGPSSSVLLEEQRGRFRNPDRRTRFEFVMPAVSDREEVRDSWFERLHDAKNRTKEPWVIEGVQYLHHPLRAQKTEKYIRPSLDLLAEIQQTGDIFFPMRWMNATIAHHNTPSAAAIVREFLAERMEYPRYLRRIVLQAADNLFRAASISPPFP
jgi:aminopeptidase N